MRKRFGFGTPRGLQGLAATQVALSCHVCTAVLHMLHHFRPHSGPFGRITGSSGGKTPDWHKLTTAWLLAHSPHPALWKPVSSTGC